VQLRAVVWGREHGGSQFSGFDIDRTTRARCPCPLCAGEASALGREFDDDGEDGHEHAAAGEARSPGNEYQNAALYASPPSSARNSGTAPGGATRGGPRSGSAGSCGLEHEDGVAGSPGLHPSGVGLAAAVASESALRRSAGR